MFLRLRLSAFVAGLVVACGAGSRVAAVVPSSEAPPTPGPAGSGFECYEYGSTRGTNGGSGCERTVAACREEAAQWSNTPSYRAGGCAHQPRAFCHHVWFDRGAKLRCFRATEDCEREQNRPGTFDKQTACAAVE